MSSQYACEFCSTCATDFDITHYPLRRFVGTRSLAFPALSGLVKRSSGFVLRRFRRSSSRFVDRSIDRSIDPQARLGPSLSSPGSRFLPERQAVVGVSVSQVGQVGARPEGFRARTGEEIVQDRPREEDHPVRRELVGTEGGRRQGQSPVVVVVVVVVADGRHSAVGREGDDGDGAVGPDGGRAVVAVAVAVAVA
eukprot:CAMPEP_0197176716 /NCGR_PEP_ID=MMETSP1423-20130617/2547_1 /TAXON_ID=476441 /ORGANISM="Pseudo-nitzschia heimii, Strain UNC1101" /LENGTH=194 /DNA_ID=CAMNT_0042626125 /DNA_START=225 /DNA_END=805 /DNA_ORIENTATION=-